MNLTYSQDVVKASADRFFRHYVGWKLPLLTVVLLVAYTMLELSGRYPQLSSMVGFAVYLPLAVMGLAFLRFRKRALEKFVLLRGAPVELKLMDKSLRIISVAGDMTINSIDPVQALMADQFWLLALGKAEYVTVPLLQLTAEEKSELSDSFARWGWSSAVP